MKSTKQLYGVFGMLFLLLCNTYGQNKFVITQYTSTNGLPQNSINGMQMDEDNFMWLATEGGLVRFDGVNFKTYREYGHIPMKSDRIRGISKTISNQILAYDVLGNTYQIKKRNLILIDSSSIGFPLGLIPNINSFKYIKKNIYNDSIWKSNKLPLYVYSISNGLYLLKSRLGLFLYKDGILKNKISFGNTIPVNIFELDKKVYYSDNKKNTYILNDNLEEFNKISLVGDILFNPIYNSIQYLEKIIWNYEYNNAYIKLGQNLYKLYKKSNNDIATQLIINNLPENCIINSILYNASNNSYYIGTDTRGLFVYKKKEFITLIHTKKNVSISNSYYAQTDLDSNSILTCDKRKFTLKGSEDFELNIRGINSEGMLTSKKNEIWFARVDSIFKYNQLLKKVTFIYANGIGKITSFYETNDTIWVGGSGIFGYIVNDKFIKICENTYRLIPYCLIKNKNNTIWAATCGGIIILNLNEPIIKPQTILKEYCIRSLFVYKNLILIGTYGNGYWAYKNNKFTQMPLDKNNCLKEVHSFSLDTKNYIWMSTNRGLFKAHIDEINNYVNDTTTPIYYSYFGKDDGIENIEFNGGCFPNSVKLKNGYFSISNMEGLVWFNPLKINNPKPSSPIFIDGIVSDKINYIYTKKIELPANFKEIIFSFSSPYWGNQANLNYEYKLQGFNDNWFALKNNLLSITYTNLPSGNYTLFIRKKVGNGKHNYIQNYVSFTVLKKFYEHAWFIFLCIVLAIVAITLIVRIYSFNIRKKNIHLEALIQNRISDLVVLNTELRQSEKKLKQSIDVKNMLIGIISHDIITPLRFISITAKNAFKGDNLLKTDFVKDIQTTSDKLHHNAQNILNWIRYQNDLIKVSKESVAVNPLIQNQIDLIVEMSNQKNNTFINDTSYDDILYTDPTILNIIIQNIFSNANKYCQNATIKSHGEIINGKFYLTIEDNGAGISPENLKRIKEIKALRSVEVISNRSGLGYIIIIELLELISGKITIESTEGIGTKITLIL